MEHSYTRYNAVHSDFTKKGGPARHQARRWVLKLLGLDAEVSNELGVLVVVRLHHALEFRSGVANDGLATALDRLADTIQLQGVLDRRIQRLDHLVRRILRCKQRSEEHTSELQSLMRISYAVFCLNKKKT